MCPPSAPCTVVLSTVHVCSEPKDARAHRRGARQAAAARRVVARARERAADEATRGAQPQADGLDQLGWQRLLPFLARDRKQLLSSRQPASGAEYEVVRGKLLKFFRAKGTLHGEELADETFDRVARKLASDRLGDVRNSTGYVLGVARLVWLESVKHEVARRARLDNWEATRERVSIDRLLEREIDLDALDRCLGELGADARALLLGYYAHDGRARIETREALVRGFGLNPGRLRVRVHRLRLQLEARLRALFAERAPALVIARR
ncbi:MAG TPA: hypothetical protein VIA18_30045 [Polyangia bacterium]|nr:hypothetical protein [Polyangia bacterium]